MTRQTAFVLLGGVVVAIGSTVLFILERYEEEKRLDRLITGEPDDAISWWPWPKRPPMACMPIGRSGYYCRPIGSGSNGEQRSGRP